MQFTYMQITDVKQFHIHLIITTEDVCRKPLKLGMQRLKTKT